MRDVVIVGAGHNALVAACYLARAGLDVEVVERRAVAGGAVSTVERFGGYQMDVGSSAHIMVRHTGIVEDLDLAAMGLVYQDLDPWGFAPFGDEAITFWGNIDAACASIEKVCGAKDAEAYHRFVDDWGDRNTRIFEAFQAPPTGANLGRHLWSVGRSTGLDGMELSRQFLTSGDALLDEHFDDERLKTALAWMGAQSGPPTHEVATADLVGWNALLHRCPPGHPVGGSGMLSVALARRFEALGGTLRLNDGCARIYVRDGKTRGIATDSGERIAATTVLAGCHVLTAFELVDDLPPAFAQRVACTIRVGNGIGMVVRLATNALPRYPGAGGEQPWRALQLLAPSRNFLRRAHGEFSAGLPPSAAPCDWTTAAPASTSATARHGGSPPTPASGSPRRRSSPVATSSPPSSWSTNCRRRWRSGSPAASASATASAWLCGWPPAPSRTTPLPTASSRGGRCSCSPRLATSCDEPTASSAPACRPRRRPRSR